MHTYVYIYIYMYLYKLNTLKLFWGREEEANVIFLHFCILVNPFLNSVCSRLAFLFIVIHPVFSQSRAVCSLTLAGYRRFLSHGLLPLAVVVTSRQRSCYFLYLELPRPSD